MARLSVPKIKVKKLKVAKFKSLFKPANTIVKNVFKKRSSFGF